MPHEGKLGKRRVEEHRVIDGTEHESSTCKGLEFQESVQQWEKTGCECWEHVIRWCMPGVRYEDRGCHAKKFGCGDP